LEAPPGGFFSTGEFPPRLIPRLAAVPVHHGAGVPVPQKAPGLVLVLVLALALLPPRR